MDELQVLTTAIGEFTVDALGRENLRGLVVTVDRRTRDYHASIALSDNSDEQQRTIVAELLDVEKVYIEEVVMSFSFAESLDEVRVETSSIPVYTLA